MDYVSARSLENFKNYVGVKFQLYNSLFTSLPFQRIEKTGIMLSLFLNHVEEGYENKQSPFDLVDGFFQRFTTAKTEQEKTDILFRFVQYAERQVVLFDALEDAAFKETNDTIGIGTLKQLETDVMKKGMQQALVKKINQFSVSLVLTAHPTQFYPDSVLGIINDLAKALKANNTSQINMYLQQLGKTPLLKKQKPTPYDEAINLIWYLENVFYTAVGKIVFYLKEHFPDISLDANPIIKMGFWPGGDRDGNPNVTATITLQIAEALRSGIIKCYYMEVRRLKRRLTFKQIDTMLTDLESKLYKNIFIPGEKTALSKEEIVQSLLDIRTIIIQQHNGLFLHLLDNFINKIQVFGLHFASLDIRQESSVHHTVLKAIADKETLLPHNYAELEDSEKISILSNIAESSIQWNLYEGLIKDTLQSIEVIKTIQQYNGVQGCSRYIISQCNSALNVLEVYALFILNGWKKQDLSIDIVPLFETIDDLKNAAFIMKSLYENDVYYQHLLRRNKTQIIMVGFSDGTKDGGYLMANWSIYKAKEELTAISKEYDIPVVFFDGRGGPPARGGGKTHKFYASMGKNISTKEIQLTIQGQTVSSNFGTVDSAQFNMEQLLNAGISNDLFTENGKQLNTDEEQVLQELADRSFESYNQLKTHPLFLDYLSSVSPLHYYSETNISSRPYKRGKSSALSLKDLRAIPFVGAWTQLKQNVPGYYGMGTALQAIEQQGRFDAVKQIYQHSLYFRTLIDNCEMAMKKNFFPLTSYLSSHPQYGIIWSMIYDEYIRTKTYLLKLSEQDDLMSNYPVEQLSIQMREKIVLPLTTIQQYALTRLREEKDLASQEKEVLEKLVMRSSFGIINAGRNSV